MKRELSHIFNIYENYLLKKHIIARRLGSMELMFLLLGHTICNSSSTVKFITTEPLLIRSRAILPIYMIDEDNDNPYYDDTIIKYMSCPNLLKFEYLTYPQYFERYSIIPLSSTTTRKHIYQDNLQNYVIKRSK